MIVNTVIVYGDSEVIMISLVSGGTADYNGQLKTSLPSKSLQLLMICSSTQLKEKLLCEVKPTPNIYYSRYTERV